MTDERLTVVPPAPAGRAPRHPTFTPGVHRPPGRPGYLTREVEERFMTALRAGNTITDAALYAGLKPDTVEKWLRRGRGVMRDRPATPEYVRFARLTEESRATARVFVVGNLVARTRTDTAAALAWLKRFGSAEWRDEPVFTGQPGGVSIDARQQVLVLPPEAVTPDLIHAVLEAKRQARTDEPLSDEVEEEHVGGSSWTRDAGLSEG